MAILTKVGRQHGSALAFLIGSYALLTLGAVTMVIPFLLMLTGSVANEWDYERHQVLPSWLWRREDRYLKVVAEKYLNLPLGLTRDFRLFSAAYPLRPEWASFQAMREDPRFAADPPLLWGLETRRSPQQLAAVRRDYHDWLAELDPQLTLGMYGRFLAPRYQDFMRRKYEAAFLAGRPDGGRGLGARERERGALEAMAEAWREARFTTFFHLQLGPEASPPYHLREWLPARDEQRTRDYHEFLRTLPGDWRVPVTARHLWLRYLENAGGNLADFNRETGLAVASYADVPLPEAEPANPALARHWRAFWEERWPLWLVRLPPDRAADYRAWLATRSGSLARFNELVQARYASWDEVPYDGGCPVSPLERNFWRDYLKQLPPDIVRAHAVVAEHLWRDFLRRRHGDLGAANAAHGTTAGRWEDLGVPLAEVDYAQFLAEEGRWVRTFLTFNYVQVFSYMAINGRAVFNTFILVLLCIAATLTVNPLAAYALSRFQMRATPRILLFLLATMAFPAEVSMIPNFLLLRGFGLLNTYGALVLPGLANGFAIFLLKGFFDSLPRELYEAATIDGAGELTMFTRITLPLCKPILAYQALMAFIGAYGGFMWAFLVCQDERMWTIMVWMYQYQNAARYFPYMVLAGFVLASVPTLVVFLFCQRIILRGIVIPSMK